MYDQIKIKPLSGGTQAQKTLGKEKLGPSNLMEQRRDVGHSGGGKARGITKAENRTEKGGGPRRMGKESHEKGRVQSN